MSETYLVNKLRDGSVLDHLRAGTALRALGALNLPPERTISVGIYLKSGRLERKDIIKIDSHQLTEEDAAKIALISPHATLSLIRNFKVVNKIELHPPLRFRGLIRCPNHACITRAESVRGSWLVMEREPVSVKCEYCDRTVPSDLFRFG